MTQNSIEIVGEQSTKGTPRAERFQKTQNAVARQVKIAKSHNLGDMRSVKESGRLKKRHALSCGVPGCAMCSNPRHNNVSAGAVHLTIQEQKFLDIEREGRDEVGGQTGTAEPRPTED